MLAYCGLDQFPYHFQFISGTSVLSFDATSRWKHVFYAVRRTTSVVQWSEFPTTDPEVRVLFPALQIFWEVVGLERGPLSVVNTIEDLLGRRSSGSGLESRETAVGIRRADHVVPSVRKRIELTSPASGGRSVGIVRSRTKATELLLLIIIIMCTT
jgi:hypothetical protein